VTSAACSKTFTPRQPAFGKAKIQLAVPAHYGVSGSSTPEQYLNTAQSVLRRFLVLHPDVDVLDVLCSRVTIFLE
jgi:hypothetical protein